MNTFDDLFSLGSVGHDTMFCLWNLTDDIIREGIKSIRSSRLIFNGSSLCKNNLPVCSSFSSSSPYSFPTSIHDNCQVLTSKSDYNSILSPSLSSLSSSNNLTVSTNYQPDPVISKTDLMPNNNNNNNDPMILHDNCNNINIGTGGDRVSSKKKSSLTKYFNIGHSSTVDNTNSSTDPISNGTAIGILDRSKGFLTLSRFRNWPSNVRNRRSTLNDKSNDLTSSNTFGGPNLISGNQVELLGSPRSSSSVLHKWLNGMNENR